MEDIESQKIENEDKLKDREILIRIYKYLIAISGDIHEIKGELELVNLNLVKLQEK